MNKNIKAVLDELHNGSHLDSIPNHDDDSLREIARSLPEGWAKKKLLRHADNLTAVLSSQETYCDDSGQPFPNCTAEDDAALSIIAMLCTRLGIDQSLPANERAGKLSELILSSQATVEQDAARLDFVIENGLPMRLGDEYRCFGHVGNGWFGTPRDAIDAAIAAEGNKSREASNG